jgi:hypothetical protein
VWLVALEAILDLLDLYQSAGESYGSPGGLNWDESRI